MWQIGGFDVAAQGFGVGEGGVAQDGGSQGGGGDAGDEVASVSRRPVTTAPSDLVRRARSCGNRIVHSRARAGMSMARNTSPGSEGVVPWPVTNVSTGSRRSVPSGHQMWATASRPAISDTIDAAANDRQTLPPTVATCWILNEARRASAHWANKRCAAIPGAAGASRARKWWRWRPPAVRRREDLRMRANRFRRCRQHLSSPPGVR